MYPDAAKVSQRILMPFWELRTARLAATVNPSPDDIQRRHLVPVLNYVAARVGAEGAAEAEDITAEVFGAAFAAMQRFPRPPISGATPAEQGDKTGDDPMRAWLFGIARRKLADSYRRRTRRPQTALPPGHPAPAGQGPEPLLLANEAARTLQAILSDLPDLQREALLLRYIDEISLGEIGRILGKHPNAVAQLLHRARQAVRARGAAYFGAIPGFDNDEETAP